MEKIPIEERIRKVLAQHLSNCPLSEIVDLFKDEKNNFKDYLILIFAEPEKSIEILKSQLKKSVSLRKKLFEQFSRSHCNRVDMITNWKKQSAQTDVIRRMGGEKLVQKTIQSFSFTVPHYVISILCSLETFDGQYVPADPIFIPHPLFLDSKLSLTNVESYFLQIPTVMKTLWPRQWPCPSFDMKSLTESSSSSGFMYETFLTQLKKIQTKLSRDSMYYCNYGKCYSLKYQDLITCTDCQSVHYCSLLCQEMASVEHLIHCRSWQKNPPIKNGSLELKPLVVLY